MLQFLSQNVPTINSRLNQETCRINSFLPSLAHVAFPVAPRCRSLLKLPARVLAGDSRHAYRSMSDHCSARKHRFGGKRTSIASCTFFYAGPNKHGITSACPHQGGHTRLRSSLKYTVHPQHGYVIVQVRSAPTATLLRSPTHAKAAAASDSE